MFECVLALTGKSHTTPEGEKLALEIVQYLKDTITRWKKEENIGYALYGGRAVLKLLNIAQWCISKCLC